MRRLSLVVTLAILASFTASPASAQEDRQLDRFAFGVGIGLVDLSDSPTGDTTETYTTAYLRILLGDTDRRRGEAGFAAYLEPEVSYWESDVRIPLASGGTAASSQSDMLVGLNLIGTTPFSKADFFLGVGLGIHFFDAGLSADNVDLGSDEVLGVNIQTGIDVRLGETFSIWGLVRTDLVEDVQEVQTKIVLGIRFAFG